ncbi:MAG: hypothetical protein KC613_18255, partial [Myxococcales bacterium]|nr:hypothetical protein [Myxococcales bacterium]
AAAERAREPLTDLIEAMLGHPARLILEFVEPDDPEMTEQESLYDQQQRARDAAIAARREAARRDPGIQRAVQALGAEIVEVRIPEVDW